MENKKYVLTEETITLDDVVLHRIKSIGTWKNNPYVFAYNFNIVKLEKFKIK